MREHLRIDTIKIFKKEATQLDEIMRITKIKNKSDAYREALDSYLDNHKRDEAYKELQKEVSQLKDIVEDLNFLIRNTLVKK